jgi:hypothetical protein
LAKMIEKITQSPPKNLGPAIISIGKHHYKYESGREEDMPKDGF